MNVLSGKEQLLFGGKLFMQVDFSTRSGQNFKILKFAFWEPSVFLYMVLCIYYANLFILIVKIRLILCNNCNTGLCPNYQTSKII
jgi:hypothetical protein